MEAAYQVSMDYDLYLRAAQAGFRFAHQRQCWGAFRLHGGNKSTVLRSLGRSESNKIAAKAAGRPVSGFKQDVAGSVWQAYRVLGKALRGSYFRDPFGY